MIYAVIVIALVSLVNSFFIFKSISAITKIIAPKLDEQDTRYNDLIKKLKKIL